MAKPFSIVKNNFIELNYLNSILNFEYIHESYY